MSSTTKKAIGPGLKIITDEIAKKKKAPTLHNADLVASKSQIKSKKKKLEI